MTKGHLLLLIDNLEASLDKSKHVTPDAKIHIIDTIIDLYIEYKDNLPFNDICSTETANEIDAEIARFTEMRGEITCQN